MIYALIDTNCWVELLRNDAGDYHLGLLESWIKSEDITVLVPEEIYIREWPKQVEFQLKEIKKLHSNVLDGLTEGSKGLSRLIKGEYNRLKDKTSRIDLLINNGIKIKATNKIKASVIDRERSGKAPFHNNKKGNNADALIYLSTIEWAKKKKIADIVFISSNKSDFSDTANVNKLHPDLLFDDILVNYYLSIGNCFNSLKTKLPLVSTKEKIQVTERVNQYFLLNDFSKMSMIDLLFFSLNKYSDQLQFIPLAFLSRIYPFKIQNRKIPECYCESFRLFSNNKDVIDFFDKAVAYRNNSSSDVLAEKTILNTKNRKLKLSNIYSKLAYNNVYHLERMGEGVDISIPLPRSNESDIVDLFNELKFKEAYTLLLNANHIDENQVLKYAYVEYLFGNYVSSAKLYYRAYENATEHRKDVLSTILLYNIKALARHIRGIFMFVDSQLEKQLSLVESKHLQNEKYSISDQTDFAQDIIEYVLNNNFYTDAYIEISDCVDKIRKHYLLQLNGGWSDAENLNVLLARFWEFNCFLDMNFVVFKGYEEFARIFDIYLEGLVMCYSLENKQGSVLSSFDNHLLLKIALHGKPDNLIKYLNQYGVSDIKYICQPKKEKFGKIATDFIKDYSELQNLISLKNENSLEINFYCKKTLANIITLMSYISIDQATVNAFSIVIIDLLKNTDFFNV